MTRLKRQWKRQNNRHAAFVISASAAETTEAKLKITSSQLKLMKEANKDSSIVFIWNDASVALPISAFDRVPAGADLVVTIKKDGTSKSVFTKKYPDAAKLIGTPYSFEASTAANDVMTPFALSPKQVIKRSFLLDSGIIQAYWSLVYRRRPSSPVPARFTGDR